MTNPVANIFISQLDGLLQYVESNWAWPSPEIGFVLYIFKVTDTKLPFKVAGDFSLSDADKKRLNQAPVLAAVGYALVLGQGIYDDNLLAAWADGLGRLSSRQPFPSDRNSFFYRPVELLGISLGAVKCHKVCSKDLDWLRSVLAQGEQQLASSDSWAFLLGACASNILSRPWKPRSLLPLEEIAAEELALHKWMCIAHRAFAESVGFSKCENEVEKILLNRCALTSLSPQDTSRAAMLHFSLQKVVLNTIESSYERNWQLGKNTRDAVELIRIICSRFHLFARQLLSRYNNRATIKIEDEYDVQNLMHALLKLHFDDIRDEEWTPSYAGSASRTDFLLKPEKIVIETKMTRKNLEQKEVANQLIIDKERYKAHPDCKTLICFVYDPVGKCKNPVALETDLSEEGSELRVVVVVAPKGT